MSLKRRLILWLIFATLAVWAGMSAFLYRDALHEVNEVFDAELAQSARLLLALVSVSAERGEMDRLQEMLPAMEPRYVATSHAQLEKEGQEDQPGVYERIIAYQVFGRDRGFRLRSENAPVEPLSLGTSGFDDTRIAGQRWRVFNLQDSKQGLILHAGEQFEIREELAEYVSRSLLLPDLMSLPALILIVWLAVSGGLRPLLALVNEVKRRDRYDLKPLLLSPIPVEVGPLVDALNALFQRLEHALENERSFTGDAAHELRRPLAALRVQAQVAARAQGDEVRRKALDQIISGVDRATHLVDQLLTLSRLDAADALQDLTRVDLYRTAASSVRELTRLALGRSVDVHIAGSEGIQILGDPVYVGLLMRNLLENAIAYSPPGGEVSVELGRSDAGALLMISDCGPGIPENEREKAFQRFHRLEDAAQKGSGLGLSIVRKIAELHRARVSLVDRPGGGLRVEVRFPLA